jgi:hypothetical protein
MATPVWQPGTPYPTGSLVQPVTAIAPVPTSLDNPGFDLGNTTGWTFTGAGTHAVTTLNSQAGTYNLGLDNGVVEGQNTENPSANPGLTIRAQIYVRLSQSGTSAGRVRLWWYDAADVLIGAPVDGNLVQKPGSQSERWVLSSLSAVAPALTASVKIGFWSNSGVGDGDTRVDSLSWDYTSASAPSGLIYKAVQPALGISDATEPVWPTTVGVQVVDGSVIWEAMIANRVVWEASPIMVSGATEPTWPLVVGESVTDGTVSWETVSLRVEDENCPNSKVVTIASSKVYAADSDIVRYSATVNPLDWTTPDDAGYLPTGLNQYGSNNTAVLNTYRSNVVPFSASTFQNWQVDPDPANITLLDSMEGIGSTWQHAAHPVANDLFYLAKLGVRTVGIAAGTSNLAAGDAGAPIDPLVRLSIITAEANETDALGMYFPSLGQYWLAFPNYPPGAPSITGDVPDGYVGDIISGTYTVSGGVQPYGPITVLTGTFPAGLTLNPDGTYSGTYTTVNSYSWTVGGVDAEGIPFSVADTADVAATPWLMIGNLSGIPSGGFRDSPDGADWSSPPYDAPDPGIPFRVSGGGHVYRNGDELLAVGIASPPGTYRRMAYNPDKILGAAGWVSFDYTTDSSGGEAAYLDGSWYASGGGFDTTKITAGVKTTVSGFTCANISSDGDFLWTEGNAGRLLKRDATGAAIETLLPPSFVTVAVGTVCCGDGDVLYAGLVSVVPWAYKYDGPGNELAPVTLPFTAPPDASYGPVVHYSAGLGLWIIALRDEVAYGPLDSLTLSSATLPFNCLGIGGNGQMVIFTGETGAASTMDLEIFDTLTVSGQDVVALGGSS